MSALLHEARSSPKAGHSAIDLQTDSFHELQKDGATLRPKQVQTFAIGRKHVNKYTIDKSTLKSKKRYEKVLSSIILSMLLF